MFAKKTRNYDLAMQGSQALRPLNHAGIFLAAQKGSRCKRRDATRRALRYIL